MKIRSFAVAVATLIAIQGNATEISTAEEFVIVLAANPAGSYTLTQNIDLTGAGFTTLDSFSGTLDGGGHILSGMGATTFCTTFAGEISALTLDGTVNAANTIYSKSGYGVFCVDCKGGKFTDVTIKGYSMQHNDGTGSGKAIGLFAAYAYDGSRFVRCVTDASCESSNNGKTHEIVGGFVGLIKIDNPQGIIVSFEDCVNGATISGGGAYNATLGVGGFVGSNAGNGSADIPVIQFVRCKNNGNVSIVGGKMNVGGFIGYLSGKTYGATTMRGVFLHCVNNGNVTVSATGGLAGGFLGQGNNGASATFDGCVNRGEISSVQSYVGGLMGGAVEQNSSCSISPYEFLNCANYGAVSGVTAAGIVGGFNSPSWAGKATYVIRNSANYGVVSGSTESAELLAHQAEKGSGTTLTFGNCFALKGEFHGTCSVLSGETNMQSAEQLDYDPSGVCAALNEVVDVTAGYMPWVIGSTGHPELSIASSISPEVDIPVVFCDSDCSILKVDRVAKGSSANPPPDPTSETGTFLGWDKPFDSIVSNTFVYALFGMASRTITFDSAGGSACEPITAAIGANIVLPTPTREGWTFVCWSENYALRMPGTMPDYDLTLKALWLQNEMPKAERLSTLLWRVKTSDYSTTPAIVGAVFGEVAARSPDFAALIGMYHGWRDRSADKIPEGYDCIVRGTNGENDGRALTIAWPTNRFEIGVTNKAVNCGSDNQCMYGIFQERGTDNYFAVLTFKVSKEYVTVASHTTSLRNLLNNIWAQYPTTTIIVCADYASIVSFDGYESECGGTPRGAIDYVISQTGMSLVSGGDDLKLVMMKSPYNPITCTVTSVDSVENEDAANELGYVTTFKLGRSRGMTLIFR